MVVGMTLKKINRFGTGWECKVAGFVSEDILLSETSHQIDCLGLNSVRQTNMFKPVLPTDTTANCCFTQILLFSATCRSIQIAKLYTLPLGSNPPPVERNSSFQCYLTATGFLWSLITNGWWQRNWRQGLLVLFKQNKKQILKQDLKCTTGIWDQRWNSKQGLVSPLSSHW